MTTKVWAVFCPETVRFFDTGNSVVHFDKSEHNYGICFNATEAHRFAQKLAQQNPGFEIQILESVSGYYVQHNPIIIEKVWTAEGEFVPA